VPAPERRGQRPAVGHRGRGAAQQARAQRNGGGLDPIVLLVDGRRFARERAAWPRHLRANVPLLCGARHPAATGQASRGAGTAGCAITRPTFSSACARSALCKARATPSSRFGSSSSSLLGPVEPPARRRIGADREAVAGARGRRARPSTGRGRVLRPFGGAVFRIARGSARLHHQITELEPAQLERLVRPLRRWEDRPRAATPPASLLAELRQLAERSPGESVDASRLIRNFKELRQGILPQTTLSGALPRLPGLHSGPAGRGGRVSPRPDCPGPNRRTGASAGSARAGPRSYRCCYNCRREG